MIKHRILSPAFRELSTAAEIYAGVDPQLGLDVYEAFEEAVIYICSFPNAWTRINAYHRRFLIRRFPYGILYRLSDGEVVIIAIIHLHSDPDSWESIMDAR